MEDNLKSLLKREKEYREKNNYYACYLTCLKILDEIQYKNEETKYDIISKIFLYPNQSNYVKLSLINSIIHNSSIINKNIKKKYYQLLIDSFSKGKDKEYQEEINKIKNLHEKSELNDYKDIDEYISLISSQILNKSNLPIDTNSSIAGESSLITLSFKPPNLIDESQNPYKPNNSLEDIINSERNADMASTIQDSFSNIKNNDKKKIEEIKYLLRRYPPNNKLPMVIMSVSAHLNSNQFLNLINQNLEKYNYRNICTIKETEMDNIRVYEYHSKNCISSCFSNIFCRNKAKSQFQVIAQLKRDENNFNMGINTFLNDTYERKISIKTIRGNQKYVIETILKFLKNYCLKVEKIQIIKQSKCFLKYNLDETLKNIINKEKRKKYKLYSKLSKKEEHDNNSISFLDDNNLLVKTNDNASKYYNFYKIFSNKEYGLGKTISEFIENFKKEYTFADEENININEIDTKKAMMRIINICEESTNTLNSTFNYTNKDKKDKPAILS